MRALLFTLCFVISVAHAAVDPAGTVQEVAPSNNARTLKADLYGWTYGNSIDTWDGRRATANGNPGDPIQINTQIIAHTKAFGTMDFHVVGNFVLQPFMGLFFQGQDPTAGIQGTVAEGNGFSYWARYHLMVPVTYKSRSEGLVTGTEAINTLSYRFPNSKFKVETVLIPSVKYYNNGDKTVFMYASPRLYYLWSDSLWLLSIYETSWESKRQTSDNVYTTGSPNLGFGFRYISQNGKGLYVQPFINTFPFGASLAAAHLGVVFGGPLL
jgi:hypothetical protein